MVEARVDSQEDFQEEFKEARPNNNGQFDDADDEEGAELQPSAFFSQMPYSSQQLINGRMGEEAPAEGIELHQMITLLHNERMAPELLPFQFKLVENILRIIK